MNLLCYISQHLYEHCIFLICKDCIALYISVVKGYTILHNKFAFISLPVLGITITFHCPVKYFGNFLVHLPSSMQGELGLDTPQGPCIINFVTILEMCLCLEFCTYNGVIVIYCFRLVCTVTNPKYMCMRWSSFLPFNDIYQCNHFTQHRFWTVEEVMQKGFQLQLENSCNNILMVFCCLAR